MTRMTLDTATSYATVANLDRALAKHGWADHRHVLVMTTAGRYTAIFPFSNIDDGDVMRYARHGFHTIG